jgi:hypothetical protein
VRAGYGLRASGFGLVFALVLAACGRGGDDDQQRVKRGASDDGMQPPADRGDARAVTPDWRVELPRDPEVGIVRSIAGPVVGEGIVVVGATGIGWAAIEESTGGLLWHLPGEGRPERAVALGDRVELWGECGHLPDARAGGCVHVVSGRAGQVTMVDWPGGASAVPVPAAAPIEIVDETLRGPGWESDDRYHAIIGREVDAIRAIGLTDGIGPVRVDAKTGAVVSRGPGVPALQVLAHTPTRGDGIAIVMRMDKSLVDDVIVHFDRDDRVTWMWPLPKPASPRVDDVGIAATDRGVVAFYDGRFAAHVGVEISNTVTP